ncbi:general transcription factor II-I repeat domain-containing protein 2B-like [Rhinophrynus dorsalis]
MSAPKRRKVDQENRSFKERWEIDYFFVKSNGKPLCLVCLQKLAVCKEYNVKRHYLSLHEKMYSQYTGELRVEIMNDLRSKLIKQENVMVPVTATDNAAVKASFMICAELIKRKKTLEDVELIKECAIKMAQAFGNEDMVKKFESVSLSHQIVDQRISVMVQQIALKLHCAIQNCHYFSVALEETTDICGTRQLIIFIRTVDENFNITEDILKFASLHSTAKEMDIYNELKSALSEHGGFEKCTSIVTDGSKAMFGKSIGLSGLLKIDAIECVMLHCIIHEEEFIGSLLKMADIMEIVIKVSNLIRSKKCALTRKKFKAYLDELDAAYGDLPLHENLCWTVVGKCLSKFFSLRKVIYLFLKCEPILAENFSDADFLSSLAFLTDITHYLHSLKKTLQEEDQHVTHLYSHISVFCNKLMLLKLNLISNDLTYFETCNELFKEYEERNMFLDFGKFVEKIEILIENLNIRFQDFNEMASSFRLYNNPLNSNIIGEEMKYQMELCDLQADLFFATRAELGVPFYKLLPKEKYFNLRDLGLRLASMFGSTYMFEKAFADLHNLKAKYGNSVSSRTLQQLLRLSVTNFSLNLDELVSQLSF